MNDQQRVVDWLDDVLAWLREPLVEMPVDRVLQRLGSVFDITGCSWHRQVGQVITDAAFDECLFTGGNLDKFAEFAAGAYRDCHPLIVWYDRTLSTEPQSCGRVPAGLVPRGRRSVLMDPLADLGIEEQMTLYYRRDSVCSEYFIVGRSGRDFDDSDIAVAGYVQRSLVTLDRQIQILAACRPAVASPRSDIGLTGRQLAVLQLLSDGLSIRQIAQRLACSPRTVEKHLQHAYRRLQVGDRVNAIRVARLTGAVAERPESTRLTATAVPARA